MPWSCDSCGGQNPDGMRFCGHCGAPASAKAPAEEPQPPEADALRSFVTGQVADRLIKSGGDLTEERRLITAVFADLSGFTPLSERLDPEELLEVIDPIIQALSDVVGRFDGFVEKFAGDALLALFGAPVAHEDDAARAVLVATEMHRELARLRARLGPDAADLTLHIGVNSGHGVARMIGSAVRMDYAVLGESVILAQRLESAAPPGETYIGETTERLVRERFQLEPVGPLVLKGKAEPVPAWRVVGELPAADRIASTGGDASPLVGRHAEVGALRSRLESLAAGKGGIVTLVGEPGVGKSRLTDEARRIAGDLGIQWLEARCLSYGAGLAYWPYVDLVRRVAGVRVEDTPQRAAELLDESLAVIGEPKLAPFLGHALGLPHEHEDSTDELEPEALRRGLHDAMAAWLRALATARPISLAVEDCHWADPSTVELTMELLQLRAASPILFYLTSRPDDGGLVEKVADEAGPERGAVHLGPLDAAGVLELAGGVLGGQPPDRLIPVLAERGDGNPFFVQETVRSLIDRRALHRVNGKWALDAGWDSSDVPDSIEGVLAARIDLLPPSAARVLAVASVIGRRIRIPLLEAVTDSPALTASLGQLLAAGFLDRVADASEDSVAFHHALMQDVAYGRLIRRRRRALHLRVADAAEALYGDGDDVIGLLARHLYLGGAGSRAIDYLVRAAERARSLFANEEARVQYARAAELARADSAVTDRLPKVLLALAEVHELRGDYDDARRLYEEARDVTGDVRAWRGIASTLRRQGRYADALTVVNEAFEDVDSGADRRPLWLEQGWSLSMTESTGGAIGALRAGLDADQRRDAWRARLLLEIGRVAAFGGNADGALPDVLEAATIFEEIDDVPGQATALRVLGGLYDDLGRFDDAADILRRGLAVAERVGSAEELGGSLINLGVTQTHQEDLRGAVESNLRALEEFERIGHLAGRAVAHVNLGDILTRLGNLDEALAHADEALAITTQAGHRPLAGDALKTRAAVLLRKGRRAEALADAEQAAEIFDQMGAEPMAREARAIAAEASGAA